MNKEVVMRDKQMTPLEWLEVMFKLIMIAALISYAFEEVLTGYQVLVIIWFYHILFLKGK